MTPIEDSDHDLRWHTGDGDSPQRASLGNGAWMVLPAEPEY
jgi:hypothetical protein